MREREREDNSETRHTLVSLSAARILDETSAKRREEVFGEGVLEFERMEMEEDAQRDFGGGMISLRGIIEEGEWEDVERRGRIFLVR